MTDVRDDSGFTLLEVVLAVALFAFAAGIIFPIFGQAPGRLEHIRDRQAALSVAQSMMVELVAQDQWSDLPRSEAMAVWADVGEDASWQWRAYEIVDEEPSSAVVAGRKLQLYVQAKPKGMAEALAEVSEVFWIVDGG